MTVTQPMWTLESLAESGPPGLWEIINGELREVSPAGGRHGRIGSSIQSRLWMANEAIQRGIVYGPDTGFVLRLKPLILRVPDVAFVRNERLPVGFDDGGWIQVAPDLVIEVISPSDRMLDVLMKSITWLEHGTSQVWVLDSKKTTVTIYESDATPVTLRAGDTLTSGDILPEFSVDVSRVFGLRG